MKTFDSGAKSSEAAPRLDLVPLASLLRQAARMAQGAASHGPRNYEKGVDDPAFIRDRKNHLVLHALRYAAGDDSDDHLGAILANAGMLARLEEMMAVPVDSGVSATRNPQSDGPVVPPLDASLTARTATPILIERKNGNTPDQEPLTYDERRLAAQPCLGGCGKLIQNATTCRPCASLQGL